MNRDGGLALTTWLAWGAAATLPLLIGRNPFPLAVTVAAVATVRFVNLGRNPEAPGWSLVIRLGLILAAVSVIFNVLTVRAGDRVITTLPGWTRWLAGELTWNAVIYGLLSATAILGLIMTWATVAASVDWAGLTRVLPDRLLGFAVGGSIALNLIPQTVSSVTEITEAAAARGFAVKGPRSFGIIVSPVVSGSMERALRLSEVLEARGFGSHTAGARSRSFVHQTGWNALLAGLCLATYALAVGATTLAGLGLAATLSGLILLLRSPRSAEVKRTRYRTETRTKADWNVTVGSVVALTVCVVARDVDSASFAYEPYPTISIPNANVWLLFGLFGLFLPALFGPIRETDDD